MVWVVIEVFVSFVAAAAAVTRSHVVPALLSSVQSMDAPPDVKVPDVPEAISLLSKPSMTAL